MWPMSVSVQSWNISNIIQTFKNFFDTTIQKKIWRNKQGLWRILTCKQLNRTLLPLFTKNCACQVQSNSLKSDSRLFASLHHLSHRCCLLTPLFEAISSLAVTLPWLPQFSGHSFFSSLLKLFPYPLIFFRLFRGFSLWMISFIPSLELVWAESFISNLRWLERFLPGSWETVPYLSALSAVMLVSWSQL